IDIRDPEFVAMSRDQLSGRAPFPWHLPRWRRTEGAAYWWPRVRQLVEDTSERSVAEHLAIAQLLPYHSEHWQNPSGPIPSQIYTLGLVRAAIERGAVIVCMLGWNRWLEVLPELGPLGVRRAHNPRTTWVTPKNLGVDAYHAAVARLLK